MLRLLILTLTLGVLLVAGVEIGSVNEWFAKPSFFREIVIFFSFSNVALYLFAGRKADRKTDFIQIYLGATVLRIVFFGVFIFIIMRIDPADASENTAFFLISYPLFTVLEVGILFKEINSQKAASEAQKDR